MHAKCICVLPVFLFTRNSFYEYELRVLYKKDHIKKFLIKKKIVNYISTHRLTILLDWPRFIIPFGSHTMNLKLYS